MTTRGPVPVSSASDLGWARLRLRTPQVVSEGSSLNLVNGIVPPGRPGRGGAMRRDAPRPAHAADVLSIKEGSAGRALPCRDGRDPRAATRSPAMGNERDDAETKQQGPTKKRRIYHAQG